MHEFITNLIQIGACIQAHDEMIVTDVDTLLDEISEQRLTEQIRATGDAQFVQAITDLSEIRSANLVVDAGTAHALKSIVCVLTNPHYPIPPVLLALRENTHFKGDDYCSLFVELLSSIESSIIICAVVVDNVLA
jgi:hypothetical protein